jgi:hypothetical protein
LLTFGGDGKLRLFEASTGRTVGTPLEHPAKSQDSTENTEGGLNRTSDHLTAIQSEVRATFSPDGRTFLTTRDFEATARLWDSASGQPLGPEFCFYDVIVGSYLAALSHDGRTVLIVAAGELALLDATSGRPLGPPLRHPDIGNSVALSPDGRTLLTGGDRARLWNFATGRPLGPPLKHEGEVYQVAFSPDGRTVLARSSDGVRLWDVAKRPEEQSFDVPLLVEARTGVDLDASGDVRSLDGFAWRERRDRVGSLGVRLTRQPQSFPDPILGGPYPTARARAWLERGRWPEAETAFDEAVKARPADSVVLLERGRFFASRLQTAKAAKDFAHALLLGALDSLRSDIWSNLAIPDREKGDAHTKALAELSVEILSNPEIGHRVVESIPRGLMECLDPTARARYWVRLGRWAEAENAYGELFNGLPVTVDENPVALYRTQYETLLAPLFGRRAGPSGTREWSMWAEVGHFYGQRTKPDKAAHYFVQALSGGAPVEEIAREITASTSIREKAFSLMTPKGVVMILDAVFPKDPFAR